MAWASWVGRTNILPLILAGPILRRVDAGSVTVWLALKEERDVTLRVFTSSPTEPGVLEGTRRTVKLAEQLHIVCVTALGTLTEDTLYQYNVYTGTASGGHVPISATNNLQSAGILRSGTIGPETLGYDGGPALPSFSLAPAELNVLKIAHGSCRKPHGGGRDHLRELDKVIGVNVTQPLARPHMLFLTGDQIYADDVADVILRMASDVGAALGFTTETPPGMTAADLVPGSREFKLEEAGLTGARTIVDEHHMKSHLITIAEFSAMYLLCYSEVFWQPEMVEGKLRPAFPTYLQVFGKEPPVEGRGMEEVRACFDSEVRATSNFWQDLAAARHALANVPTYMIFDDHEITDDWFLDRAWVNTSIDTARPLFMRVLQNGLAAYAIFQAWGNDPPLFQPGQLGDNLLTAVSAWAVQPITEGADRHLVLQRRLGLPTAPIGDSPAMYPRHAEAVRWHYRIEGSSFRVLVLDTRTQRAYGSAHGHPSLLAEEALDLQLPPPPSSFSNDGVTIIISPAPLVGNPTIESLQGFPRKIGMHYLLDAEYWIGSPVGFQRFLFRATTLGNVAESRIVVLSGDVHYAYSAQLRLIAETPFQGSSTSHSESVIAQFTASAFKNAGFPGTSMHSDGRANILLFEIGEELPEVVTYCWNNPALGLRPLGTIDGDIVQRGQGLHPVVYDLEEDFTLGSEQPDWRLKLKFVRSEEPRTSPTGPNPVPSTGGDPDAKLSANLTTAANHQTYQRYISSGANAVGRNNLGEITFVWGPDEKTAIHRLFWSTGEEDDDDPAPQPALGKFSIPMSLGTETF